MTISWEITQTEDTSVDVSFTCSETAIVHARSVNTTGCGTDELLQARLGEVAAGVHNKIQCGAITAAAEPAADPE
tara:strand:+ start:2004 stop:2228 length:225 start_codon:yes stop_codon:yes gene_type:complete